MTGTAKVAIAVAVLAVIVVIAVVATVTIRHDNDSNSLPALPSGPGWARLVEDPHTDAPGNPQPVPQRVTAGSLVVQVQFFGVEHDRASLNLWVGEEKPTSGTYAAGDAIPVAGGTLEIAAVHADPAAVDVHLVPDGG